MPNNSIEKSQPSVSQSEVKRALAILAKTNPYPRIVDSPLFRLGTLEQSIGAEAAAKFFAETKDRYALDDLIYTDPYLPMWDDLTNY